MDSYNVNSFPLDCVNSIPNEVSDLGVILDHKLKFVANMVRIVLGFIKEFCTETILVVCRSLFKLGSS